MKDHQEKKITRRKFVKTASKRTLGGLILSKINPTGIPDLFASHHKSKVVSIYHPDSTDGTGGKDNDHLNESIVTEMVNAGVTALTGESSTASAWAAIIPDPTKKVAIKVNCQITGIYTKSRVVNGIIKGLVERGVSEDNIIIYDRTHNAFKYAGFVKNTGNGVKIGTVDELGGWSSNPNLHGMAKLMCNESRVYDCDYLINVPCHKALDGYSGVTLSMKNHYGTCTPIHKDIMYTIPKYNNLSQIRDKTRLIVLDAIFTQYQWFGARDQSTVDITNKLIFSTDPVALDYVGWKMIDALRQTHGLSQVEPAPEFIRIAAETYGLGTDNPDKIEVVDINLSQTKRPLSPSGLEVVSRPYFSI